MNVFKWFDTAEIDELAGWMVKELVIRVPPSTLDAHEKKGAVRLRNAHDAVFDRARKLSRTRRLNVYQKARFGNQFRWGLRDAGYPLEFVESWTQDLITVITIRRATGRPSEDRPGKV